MVRIFPTLVLTGEHFSPEATERRCNLKFQSKVEPGSTSKRGTQQALGTAILALGAEDGAAELPLAVVQEVVRLVPKLQESGAEDLTLHLNVEYDEQCNFEVDPEVLQGIAASGTALTVSCYPIGAEEFQARYGG
jgi:hypothetical protein